MRQEGDRVVRRNVSIGCAVGAIMIIGCVFSYAMDREQDQESPYEFVRPQDVDHQKVATGKRTPSFPTYCWRIMTAPVMVLCTFPFDEETNIYHSYLAYVNKNSDRQWRKKEYTLKKENLMGAEVESDAETDTEQPTS